MTISADEIARVRRMTNEQDSDPMYSDYPDSLIESMAEGHKFSESGYPGDDVTVYDLYAIAAEIWEEKTAALSPEVTDGSADEFGDTSDKFVDTAYEHAKKMADYYRERSKPRSRRMVKYPREVDGTVTL